MVEAHRLDSASAFSVNAARVAGERGSVLGGSTVIGDGTVVELLDEEQYRSLSARDKIRAALTQTAGTERNSLLELVKTKGSRAAEKVLDELVEQRGLIGALNVLDATSSGDSVGSDDSDEEGEESDDEE